MTKENGNPMLPEMGKEHKMHSNAEGHEVQKASEEHTMHQIGQRTGKPHEMHQGRHEGHITEDFKRRFIISLVLTLPILALSPFIQDLLRFRLEFPSSIYALFLLSTLRLFLWRISIPEGLIQ